ncbi:MAG: hypothetical protein MK193_03990 [Lentisphaeria bacterium]|nr:hypothetical protein [Lentisphaeria bacterium]
MSEKSDQMTNEEVLKYTSRLFNFVKRAKILIVGRQAIEKNKHRLHFVLLTNSISKKSEKEICEKFKYYPVIKCYEETDIEEHFDFKGTKVLAFEKGDLAKSIYQELKRFRINQSIH